VLIGGQCVIIVARAVDLERNTLVFACGHGNRMVSETAPIDGATLQPLVSKLIAPVPLPPESLISKESPSNALVHPKTARAA
jgi:hypothetical protein